MQRKLSPRPTFKPRLESLETRDVPSAAGLALFQQVQNIQQGVQAMQSQANAASSDFTQFGKDVFNSPVTVTSAQLTDITRIGGDIQSVRFLNTQIQAQLGVFQQAVVGVASDGDKSDQTLAIFAFLQVNGISLFPGSNSGSSLASQAQNALNQVDAIASTHDLPLPKGGTAHLNLSFDDRLNGKS